MVNIVGIPGYCSIFTYAENKLLNGQIMRLVFVTCYKNGQENDNTAIYFDFNQVKS